MPFTVDDFDDLLHLLREHPEWQERLRAIVLSRELLELPTLFQQLVEAQASLTEEVRRIGHHLEQVERQLAGLTEQVSTLGHHVDQMGRQLAGLTEQVSTLTTHVGTLRGQMLEIRYERYAGAYFGRLLRRMRVVGSTALVELLDDAVDDGRITMDERDKAMLTDLVLTGRRREDGTDVYLAVEISAGIGNDDVSRAIERARILEKLGRPAVPVVAGEWIDDQTARYAASGGVWRVLNGRTVPPQN